MVLQHREYTKKKSLDQTLTKNGKFYVKYKLYLNLKKKKKRDTRQGDLRSLLSALIF